MIQVSWGVVVGIGAFMAVVGPGFYWMGRLSMRVDHNSAEIQASNRVSPDSR